jgi:broad specificity phosphatase PhoE
MTKFFIFRHGQTDWNLQKRFQGRSDIPLNETGRRQAEELAERLKHLPVEVILSSSLSRALDTAKIAFKGREVDILSSDALMETHMGDAEGMYKTDVLQTFGSDSWERFVSLGDMEFRFPNGESKGEQLKRSVEYLEKMSQVLDFEGVGVSTHGGVLLRLVHYCVNAPAAPIAFHNCAAYELHLHDGQWLFKGPV